MQTEDDIRRRRAFQDALNRGLQAPALKQPSPTSSFMPGESAGIPTGIKLGGISKLPDPRNLGLSLPQPATPPINLEDMQPPTPNEPVAPASSPRIGYSTAGLTGTDALIQRRRALEEADPESQVTAAGEILPPRKTGHLRGLGQGALIGLGTGDPDRPLYSLGQMIGGAVTGAVSPRSVAKMQRRFDLGQLDTDLARGLKLEGLEQEVRGPKWGQTSTRVVREGEYPGIEAGTEIRVRVDPRTGSVTDIVGPNQKPVISDLAKRPSAGAPHYEKDADGYMVTIQGGQSKRVVDENGKPLQIKRGKDDEEYVEVTVNGRTLKVSPSQALTYYGQIGAQETKLTTEQAERKAKAEAAQQELESLETAEEAARVEKDRAYQTLDAMRKDPNLAKEDIAQAEAAAKAADTQYQSFGEKKRDAKRRITENTVATPPPVSAAQPYAGRTMSRADLERYAKDKGLSIEEAEKQVRAQGVQVQ